MTELEKIEFNNLKRQVAKLENVIDLIKRILVSNGIGVHDLRDDGDD